MTQHYLGEPKAWFGAAAENKDYRHEYVTLTSNGIKEEGAPLLKLFDEPAEAMRAYADEFEQYVRNATTVVWRALPEVEGGELGFYVTSRLYRTNKFANGVGRVSDRVSSICQPTSLRC